MTDRGFWEEFRWPSANDDLLDTSGSWTRHAEFDWRRDTIVGRMEGYHRAALVLAEQTIRHPSDINFLIYPIVNCWRHHIELQLKALLPVLQKFLDEPVNERPGHSILRLWEEVEPRLRRADPHKPEDLEHAGRLIRQLHDLDPDGQNFRYHRRRDGTLALAGKDRIDIEVLQNCLDGVSNFLYGAHDKICHDQEVRDALE